ncbi:MAG: tyrosine-type recombinase/integrase, partial [Solirubrobacteraceae bacterium]
THPLFNLVAREHKGRVFYEAKFRYAGRQVMRRVGPAWLQPDAAPGEFKVRHGRVQPGYFDQRAASVRAAELVARYVAEEQDAERIAEERRTRGVTFREVAHAYLDWLENVKGAKPTTMRSHRSVLAEPGTPHARGRRMTTGFIMGALGDAPANKITTAEVEQILHTVAKSGVTPRTVNHYREIICAAFNYGMRPGAFSLLVNPAKFADRRRAAAPGVLRFYTYDEVEMLARALADGLHRPHGYERLDTEAEEDQRDAEAVRVSAYAGLRMGELLALRWADVDWQGSALTISRAISDGLETTTKSGQVRRVPMGDDTAAALERLTQRGHFTYPEDLAFCNLVGRRLDSSALRRRFKRARDAAGLRPLRWHDLRHSYGSMLVAGGIDLVSIKEAMGHAQLTTTSRYLHARPATELAAKFTDAIRATGTSAAVSEE